MQEIVSTPTASCAATLADALTEFVADLSLIEFVDMIGYIRGHKWATIADLVQSSSELWFRDGTLLFACMGDVFVDWLRPPSISLELEFQNDGVSAFFTLVLGPPDCLIDLKAIWFACTPADDEAAADLFARAIADARLSRSSFGRT